MAMTAEDIKTAYPLPVYNYRVEIDGQSASFSEVSGLNITIETITYRESPTESGAPGPRAMHMPGQGTPVDLTLKKGMVKGKSVPLLYDWINSVQINQVQKKDIKVQLCDETGAPVLTWTVVNAFPKKLDAPTFDATSNDAAIESLELMADALQLEEH